MQEKIIETKTCRLCGSSFGITDEDLKFYEKISPVFNLTKYPIPTPTLCPDCRQQRRLSFRNERKLYKRNCDATGKDIISIYSPDKGNKVYNQKDWWSDKWDPLDYGKVFDFKKTFYEQYVELFRSVPRLSLVLKDNENVEYGNDVETSKDCYLIFNAWDIRNSFYSSAVGMGSSDLVDCIWATESSDCYSCIKVSDAHNSFFCMDCKDISECLHCIDCIGCRNCFGCAGLHNKQYHIFNEIWGVEGYEKKMEELKKMKKSELEKLIKEKQSLIPRKFMHSVSSENVIGDYFNNSKNCFSCYDMMSSQDCRYCYDGITLDSYDIFNCGTECFKLYEAVSSYFSNNLLFSNFCHGSNDVLYSDHCYSSSYLFGCVGLRNKKHCILNKQYTKEQYEELVQKIVEHMKKTGEWGEFFPSSISPFGYNETIASEYFPLLKEEAISRGFNWSDYEPSFPKVEKVIPASKLPLDIKEIPDDILNWAIECEVTKKPFRIIRQELDFYRKHDLPIPRKHPDQRHLERMKLRNPRKLWKRNCDNCHKEIETSYAPERLEIVYCEECYEKLTV